MKQAQKNQQSREFILKYAFAEFSEHGYCGSSLNQICVHGNISKGLLYHYYTNKDTLYLACVELLFHEMTSFLQEQINLDTVTIEQYFDVRMQFFQKHPAHHQLFYDLLLYPQSHLAQNMEICRASFDHFNNQALRIILQNQPLSEHITLEDALQQFSAFINFLGVYMREGTLSQTEQKTRELLHTMLYGLIAR